MRALPLKIHSQYHTKSARMPHPHPTTTQALGRFVKKGGQVWIRMFPDIPVSKKPSETRMGRGKGEVELYIARVPAGKVMYAHIHRQTAERNTH
jgi:ribosomal protein L16